MNLTVVVRHSLTRERLRARLEVVARERGAQLQPDPAGDRHRGILEKGLGFLGRLRARYAIEAEHVEFTVIQAPTLMGEARLRSLIEDEIGRELSRLESDPSP